MASSGTGSAFLCDACASAWAFPRPRWRIFCRRGLGNSGCRFGIVLLGATDACGPVLAQASGGVFLRSLRRIGHRVSAATATSGFFGLCSRFAPGACALWLFGHSFASASGAASAVSGVAASLSLGAVGVCVGRIGGLFRRRSSPLPRCRRGGCADGDDGAFSACRHPRPRAQVPARPRPHHLSTSSV